MTRAAAALEPADIEAILREGQLPVLRYVLSRAASPAEAHDLAQETLVRAYRALAQGHRPRQPVPWLLAIARNVLLETWRSHRYERRLKERLAYVMGPEWQSPWQERVERRVVVGDAVDALPPELREPVVLHYFGGLPVAAVAGHLDITPGAVKMRLLRARQTLRGALEDLMNETTRPTTISIPDDLAARAKLLAEKPPLYDSISVAVQVGGRRWPTSPMSPPALSGEMPSLDDLRLAVERLHAVRLAGDRPLTDRLTLWPALDPFEHAQPAAVRSLLGSAEVGTEDFRDTEEGRLIPTEGWCLGTDSDWRRVLEDTRQDGLRHVWFTFLGLETTHDALCGRPGAFRAVVTAMERCAAVGLETGANLVVSTRNTGEIGDLDQLVRTLGGERFVPTYVEPWSTNLAYETIRPEPKDLEGLPPEVPADGLDVNWGYRQFWADPAACSEGALTRTAAETGAPTGEPTEDVTDGSRERRLSLFVDAGLDLYVGYVYAGGVINLAGARVANLRDDPPEEVREKLLSVEWPPEPPPDADLARRYGDPNGRRVFMSQAGLRRKWLEAWRAEHGLPWITSL